MPVLSEHTAADAWIDPDTVPRQVVAIGTEGIVSDHLDQRQTDFHHHQKGELVLTLRGVITCEVENAVWLVPPQTALWIPAGVTHRVNVAGIIQCYLLFIDNGMAGALPSTCCAVTTTALLRELLVRAASLPVLYDEQGMPSRLVALMLDELALAPLGDLHLPMPTDTRLRRVFDLMMDDPSDRSTMDAWSRRVGLSERTMARLLARETGLSFGRWRQQLHLLLAVKWLDAGQTVQQVADGLGYESAGSFVTMFRKAMGAPPARYMAGRRSPQG